MKVAILLVAINLFIGSSFCQINLQDTMSFRKDFEKLLTQYGLSIKGYTLNVTSINQSGGQTAFIITNNYFRDTILDESNVDFKISGDSNSQILIVYPKKDVWVSPFVFSDSSSKNQHFFDPGIGVSSYVHGISVQIDGKMYPIAGPCSSRACSRKFPLHIYMDKKNQNEFFIFGDFQNSQKVYLFYQGKISWLPMQDEVDELHK